ncbi:MAG TPA: ABC transporter permease [Lachnospiraceae bacterium]|nr:ABC transporter permease [Lachnospiraceae bacterium]
MRQIVFAARNRKELLRDPISLVFGIGLPVVLLGLISIIQNSVPDTVAIFELKNFVPGIAVFSFSFLSMFSGMLIAKDRTSSFLARLFASPMKASEYIVGYSLPLLPLALLQSVVCFLVAFLLGLPVNSNVILSIIVLLPSAFLFIGLGLLMGSAFTDKQVGGIASILVQVAALSSGMWFDLDAIGGSLKTFCYMLPFAHAVDAAQAALAGDYVSILVPLIWVTVYAAGIFTVAVVLFKKKMYSDN